MDEQGDIELRRARVGRALGDDAVGHDAPGRRSVLEDEHHLEQGRAREVAVRRQRLDHLLEGQVLVRQRFPHGVADSSDEVDERRAVGHRRANDECVDEEPDERLDLRQAPVRHRTPDEQVRLTRLSMEKCIEGRQQRDVRGHSPFAREPIDRVAERSRQGERTQGARERLDGRPRSGRRQRDLRLAAGQSLRPVLELLRARAALEPRALPDRVVGIVNGERGEPGRDAFAPRPIECEQIRRQDPERPSVRDDVVHGQHQRVPLGSGLERESAQKHVVREIERPSYFRANEPIDLAPRGILDVAELEGHRDVVPDRLDRTFVDPDEVRPQRLVPETQSVQRGAQRRQVQRALDVEGDVQVVDGLAGRVPVEKPEALLGIREQELAVARRRENLDRGPGQAGLLFDGARQRRERPRLEDRPERYLDVPLLLNARRQARRHERVAASVEEAPASSGRMAEEIRRDLQELDLRRALGPRALVPIGDRSRGRKSLPIQLVGGRQRKCGELDEVARHHGVGQDRADEVTQVRGGRPGESRLARVVGDELLFERIGPPEGHRGERHRRVPANRGLDFAELDPVPAELDLRVDAPEKLERAVTR